MNTGSIKMSSEEIQHFLEQLWTVVSNPSNHDIVKWTKGGRVFKVVDEVFYSELCPEFYAGCDENYFDYFMNKCGFKSIPPLEKHFHHPDFLQLEYARIKNIQPKQTLYTPFAYYSFVLETPYPKVPFIQVEDEESPPGSIEVTASSTLKKRKSVGSKAALVQDTATEFETLDCLVSNNRLKETFNLDLSHHSPSEDHSLKSTCSTLVPTPDSGISCSTPESLFPTIPSKVIPTKNGYENELTLNLNECRLEDQESDSSSSTLTSGSNSPNFPASSSLTADVKASSESPDIPPSTDNIKDLKSTSELDLSSSMSNEERANHNSESIPRTQYQDSSGSGLLLQASDVKKL